MSPDSNRTDTARDHEDGHTIFFLRPARVLVYFRSIDATSQAAGRMAARDRGKNVNTPAAFLDAAAQVVWRSS
jgi:hypothetical protein